MMERYSDFLQNWSP